MAQTGTAAEVSVAPQPQAYYKQPYDETLLPWYKFKTVSSSMGLMQGVQQMPPETGADLTPTDMFKDMVMFAGEFELLPRTSNVFGWLLYGALGKVTSAVRASGAYTHTFEFADDQTYIPWMSFRRLLPGKDRGGEDKKYGEIGYDSRIASLRFTVPARGQVAVSGALQALNSKTVNRPNWTYENADYDAANTIPLAGYGSCKIGGEDFSLTGVVIEVNNGMTNDEFVVGNFHLDDMTMQQRVVSIRAVIKYRNADILNQINTGSKNGSEWSPKPFTVDSANSAAFEAILNGSEDAQADDPYGMAIRAGRVVWQVGRPIQIAGGEIIQQEVIGTVVTAPAGTPYFEVDLINNEASYDWPSRPAIALADTTLQWDADVDGAVALDATLAVTSLATDFDGGQLIIETSYNNTATTELGGITAANIGTVDAVEDGTAGKRLVINLDTSATPASVTTELQALTFNDTAAGTAPLGYRGIRITLSDGDGGYAQAEREIRVV